MQSDNVEEIDATLTSLRDFGFINFYGMQRFGTSTIPTHVIGLYILRGEWKKAIDALLSLREGEHPDCQHARLAWLEDGDVDKALQLMPRRCVAERSIWEFWRRGNRQEDMLGALGNVSHRRREDRTVADVADTAQPANDLRARVPKLYLESGSGGKGQEVGDGAIGRRLGI